MSSERFDRMDSKQTEEIPGQGLLDSFLIGIRVLSSIGAVVAIITGIVLAVQLFGYFRAVVGDPTAVIAAWQNAMDNGRPQIVAEAPLESSNVVDGAIESTAPDSAAAQTTPVLEVDGVPRAETDETAVLEAETSEPLVPAADVSGVATNGPVEAAVRPVVRDDVPPFVAFADTVLDRLEVGAYSWLIGVGFLTIFCWFLLKIPVMLITTGTKLLLGLVNVSAD